MSKKSILLSVGFLLLVGTTLLSAKFWGSDCVERWESAGECQVKKRYCTDYIFWIPIKTNPELLTIEC